MEEGRMKILTDLQRKVLDALFALESISRHFYLTGGTALAAYYLYHRISYDLDIFTHSVEISDIEGIAEEALRLSGLEVEKRLASPTFRRYFIENELQLNLVHDRDFRVGSPQLIEGIMVDNLKNIAVNKICSIYGRLDPKDYVDLYFILKDRPEDILELIKIAQNKDRGLEPFQWSKVIADAAIISVLPRMIMPLDLNEMKKWYKKLREIVLDSIRLPV